ncbi:MAG: hypothetical protein IPH24_12255 [Crocinitomicaceae bacterium]|nr:hypothetical protein [Crocinitomicaceae bacterium]
MSKNELSINFRSGLPTQNMVVFIPDSFKRYDYLQMRSVSDMGAILKYKFRVWKKWNIYVSSGIELSQSKHYQPIFASGYAQMHLDNIIIKKNRFTVNWFGLHKQFQLYNDKLLIDFGCEVVDKFYFSKVDNYSSDYIKNSTPTDQWIDYSYDLTTYYDQFYPSGDITGGYRRLFLDWNLHLKFLLSHDLYFDFGFNYTRNNLFFYDYSYSVRYYVGGSETPTNYYSFLGTAPPHKNAVRNHYLYLNFGLSYKFGNNKPV